MRTPSAALTVAALAACWIAAPAVAADEQATLPAGAPAVPSAEAMKRWGEAPIVLVGKLTHVQAGPVGLSEPPMYTHNLTFQVTDVLRGDAKAGADLTCGHVMRGERPTFPQGKVCIVAAAEQRQRMRASAVVAATPELLAEAKLACSVPIGWSVADGKLFSPWAKLGKKAWPKDAKAGSRMACAKTGRPALLTGPGVTFTVAPVPPVTAIKWTNPDGDGQYAITVANATDKPVTVPALLSDGKDILWNESLVILCQGKAYTAPRSVGVKGKTQPVQLKPGQKVSGKVNVLMLDGPNWPQGGYRIEFTFCLGEKASVQSLYYMTRHHGKLRDAIIREMRQTSSAGLPGGWKITVARRGTEGNRVTAKTEGRAAVVDVISPGGIGTAIVHKPAAGWPQEMLIRLHLKTLEGFRITAGRQTHDAALSREENTRRAIAGKIDKTIEVTVPKKLLDNQPDKLTLEWVDAYR